MKRKISEEEFISIVENSGTWSEVMEQLQPYGISDQRNVRRRGKKLGVSPASCVQHNHDAPDGFKIKGTSTLIDAAGKQKLQWIKTSEDKERQLEMMRLTAQAFVDDIRGKSKPIPEPEYCTEDLLSVYPSPEPHIGMRSWKAETGNNYDLKKAIGLVTSATQRLVDVAPPATDAIIVNVGDWFHTDDSSNATFDNKNQLDVDGRWHKLFSTGVFIQKRMIELALAKHKRVKVVITPGNHDQHTSYCLNLIMDAYFENNKRVEIDLGVTPYKYHRHGKCLLGITHGDKTKMELLPGIMSCDCAKDWGQTEYRYWLTGHIHHLSRKEFPGCVVESFRSIAAKDSWHAARYQSGRDMQMIVYHNEWGEVERHRIGVEQLT